MPMFDGTKALAIHAQDPRLPEVLPNALLVVVAVLRLGCAALDFGDLDLRDTEMR